jgi:Flp pilus assembly protein TadD
MRLYSLIALGALFFVSCAAAVPVRIVNHYDLSSIPNNAAISDKDQGQKDLTAGKIKYLVRLPGAAPSAVINNRALELCLDGKLSEAQLLLLQIPENDSLYSAVCNNLGVVAECLGNSVNARNRYIQAAVMDPSCGVYLGNLRTVKTGEK